ncbi:MAG: hypothetical protein Q7R35_14330 [Elusimicrobiota bacterium]|nr:hypothetical protein [Elusimicrobiota bacterium]
MEEEEGKKNWLMWLIIVPVAMGAGVLLTKLALGPGKPPQAAPAEVQAEARPRPAAPQTPKPAPAAADNSRYDLPGDEPAAAEPGVVWGDKTYSTARKEAAPGQAETAAIGPEEAQKFKGMGAAYGALSKAAGKILNNPKAVSALLNNDYVVKGFMARDSVKNATANSASLANYLKNPENMNKFMGKDVVRAGMNNGELVGAVAGSKLAMALLNTPGGQAFLKDPRAIADVLQSNPGLIGVLTNPAILSALTNNPKTVGVVGQLGGAGLPR